MIVNEENGGDHYDAFNAEFVVECTMSVTICRYKQTHSLYDRNKCVRLVISLLICIGSKRYFMHVCHAIINF